MLHTLSLLWIVILKPTTRMYRKIRVKLTINLDTLVSLPSN